VSGPVRGRRSWPRLAGRVLPAIALLGLTATLAAALQVREVRVTGTRLFPPREVEAVLQRALGTPTVAARAGDLRASVRALPWVEDATVRVSLDGIVSCAVVERTPVAVAVDHGPPRLVDREGRLLAPAEMPTSLLELDGFAAYPEERAAVLASVQALQRGWDGRLERVERLASHDVTLRFADTPFPVLADPGDPQGLRDARRVFTAWMRAHNPAPLRMDARVAGRIAVLPAPPVPKETP
jgi:cell division septal protein FtsQ